MSLQTVAASVFRRMPRGLRTAVLHRTGRYAPWEEGFDFSPPRLEPGEVYGPPDFVGIGVQKAGTTWWYHLIVDHPGAFTRPPLHKERHFLARYAVDAFGPSDIEAYHRWFPRPPGRSCGEWTPDYLSYPWVADLLARAAPDARLLLLVRDPVERFSSGLAHQLRHGARRTGATLAEALQRGFYDQALECWSQHGGTDRLCVLQYEACVLRPRVELARTYRFLGLDPAHVPAHVERPVSPTPPAPGALSKDARSRLVDLYAPDVMALAKRFPELDLTMWPNFADLAS